MKEKILAIVNGDKIYADRLASYLESQKTIPLYPHVFAEAKACKVYAEDHPVEIILVDEEQKEMFRESSVQVVLLAEDKLVDEKEKFSSVYKYQRADRLVCSLLDWYVQSLQGNVSWKYNMTEKKIVGIYSPVNRCGKTTFGLLYSRMLAGKGKVLFLNLEPFSGLLQRFGFREDGNLSDVIYYIKERRETIFHYIQTAVENHDGLYILPPVLVQSDIGALEEEDWSWFFGELVGKSDYDVIVVELSSSMRDMQIAFRECSRLYVPSLRDNVSAVKVEEFREYLTKTGQQKWAEEMAILYPPKGKDWIDEEELWSCMDEEYTAYLKELLEKEQV